MVFAVDENAAPQSAKIVMKELQNSSALFAVFNSEYILLTISEGLTTLVGTSKVSVQTDPLTALPRLFQQEKWQQSKEILKTSGYLSAVNWLVRPDGAVAPYQFRLSPSMDKSGGAVRTCSRHST